ncbi:MAG TPA: ABC-type transport auxiliary lipoprotein family protein [Burkholderiales bacterium]|jgi:cholesterol transport system auxiliary component
MRWIVAALACVLTGCISTGGREAQRYYILEDAGAKAAESKAARAGVLLLTPPTTSSFYDTQGIAYSRAPGMRAYYQYHSWTEAPGRRIGELLGARLERSGAFSAVASVPGAVRGELVLSIHLTELYHDAAAAPGTARVALVAELVDPSRRALVTRRSFEASAPAATYDAPGAVQAFNRAIALLLDDVTAWVDGAAR